MSAASQCDWATIKSLICAVQSSAVSSPLSSSLTTPLRRAETTTGNWVYQYDRELRGTTSCPSGLMSALLVSTLQLSIDRLGDDMKDWTSTKLRGGTWTVTSSTWREERGTWPPTVHLATEYSLVQSVQTSQSSPGHWTASSDNVFSVIIVNIKQATC